MRAAELSHLSNLLAILIYILSIHFFLQKSQKLDHREKETLVLIERAGEDMTYVHAVSHMWNCGGASALNFPELLPSCRHHADNHPMRLGVFDLKTSLIATSV